VGRAGRAAVEQRADGRRRRPAKPRQPRLEPLTDALLARVAAQPEPAVFMLWGASAQRKRALVERGGPLAHCVLMANHPSPLSALRPPVPFVGCRHFTAANAFLAAHRPAACRSIGS